MNQLYLSQPTTDQEGSFETSSSSAGKKDRAADRHEPPRLKGAPKTKRGLTSGKVAKLLGIPSRTVRRYLRTGRIAGQQNPITGSWKISQEALVSFAKKYNIALPNVDQQGKVLLVGQSEDLGPMLEEKLSHLALSSAPSIFQALLHLAEQKPDLLLLVSPLPARQLVELGQALHEHAPTAGIKVLLLACDEELRVAVKCLGFETMPAAQFSDEDVCAMVIGLLREKLHQEGLDPSAGFSTDGKK